MALKEVGFGGLFFKINKIASKTIHLLQAFLWIKKKKKKKKKKVDFCGFLILIKAVFQISVAVVPSVGGGGNFKFALED